MSGVADPETGVQISHRAPLITHQIVVMYNAEPFSIKKVIKGEFLT
jgi:hypothetical protein|tara:strand:+ start:285 stop:422 length:138 start_codon:yes stop_codon:yes gene_type:complete